MFHVSLLKPYKGQPPLESMALPTQFINVHPILEPHHVLQEQIVLRHKHEVPQVLVQWQNLSPLEATWEDAIYMQQEFPNFNLEDKVIVNRGSIDITEQISGEESTRDGQEVVLEAEVEERSS